ncbi:TRAP transporter small permease [Limimaricola sp. G21655-S1]|uniref:TRAP transporter small permease n=1 Tax=Limimaricola sp. G21655-S1 TaxID=3014768 RepID=UPI0022AF0211|nr:TRAP transporter small permease [Limimaricola sp. G21655-S1]MCZ4260647.1 TRAP transporter small permease [Limimaricola sp. G21655-S1]
MALSDTTMEGERAALPGWLMRLVRVFAGIGGAALVAIMLVTVASVTLRGLLGRPIPGDYELVELGSAIAIFCFLPWCQATGGNVVVDFFTQGVGPRATRALDALGDLIWLLIAALLLWRLTLGGIEMHEYDEQTMVLRLPVWWSFFIVLPAMTLLVATCAATLIAHLRGMRT